MTRLDGMTGDGQATYQAARDAEIRRECEILHATGQTLARIAGALTDEEETLLECEDALFLSHWMPTHLLAARTAILDQARACRLSRLALEDVAGTLAAHRLEHEAALTRAPLTAPAPTIAPDEAPAPLTVPDAASVAPNGRPTAGHFGLRFK